MIRFRFNLNKAVGAMVYLLRHLGPMDKIKLIKLLYLADRKSLLEHDHPLTGDRQVAMPYGPVPSACLDAINGNTTSDLPFRFMHVDDARIELRPDRTGEPQLAPEEIAVLDSIIQQHGNKQAWALARWTEQLPEFKEVYVEGTSRTIPYETILKHHGTDRQFHDGRPVISRRMAAHMLSPFPSSEPDL